MEKIITTNVGITTQEIEFNCMCEIKLIWWKRFINWLFYKWFKVYKTKYPILNLKPEDFELIDQDGNILTQANDIKETSDGGYTLTFDGITIGEISRP